MGKFIDITGKTFGELTVIHRVENNKQGRPNWKCRCSCGESKIISGTSLKSGNTKSCNGHRKEAGRFKNIVDQTFGFWKVISRKGNAGNHATWNCLCECGATRILKTNELNSGSPQSCGCKRGTHGHTKNGGKPSPTYSCWKNMIARCTQPSNPAFIYYQKRGITVCDRWRKFENFLEDAGERPSTKHSIDRWPDNDGNYQPQNFRWATKVEQANNRVTNIMFEFQGEMFTLTNLARHTGVNKETLRARLCRSPYPWTVEGAVKTPRKIGHKGISFFC